MVSTDAQATGETVEVTALPHWVVFSCDGERFAVPLLLSREVVPPQRFTRLPGCGPEVVGLMAVQGRVVTVFDLGRVLGLASALRLSDYRVLMLDHGDRVLAVVVDAVLGIAREQAAMLQTDPGELGRLESLRSEVLGAGTYEAVPYLALDPNRILSRLLP
jgi:chemotaxis signal transduction protein